MAEQITDRPIWNEAPETQTSSSEETRGDPILVATGLTKIFKISNQPHVVVNSVDLAIEQGEIVAIMGPSGCGKSTLLHILGGLEPPTKGSVKIVGKDLATMNEKQRTVFRRDKIGFVFQFFNLIPNLTAAENINLPLKIAKMKTKGYETVQALMNGLNLKGLQGHRPEEISGGEQQRVAIARALVRNPVLLMADEPTGNLDYTTSRDVLELIKRTCITNNRSAIIVTHEARAAAYADRVLVMRDGSFVGEVVLGRRVDTDPSILISRLAALDL